MGPPSRRVTFNGVPVKLTQVQYRRYNKLASEIVRRRLAASIAAAGWKNTDDQTKARILRKVIKAARKSARAQLRRARSRTAVMEVQ